MPGDPSSRNLGSIFMSISVLKGAVDKGEGARRRPRGGVPLLGGDLQRTRHCGQGPNSIEEFMLNSNQKPGLRFPTLRKLKKMYSFHS